MHCGDGPVSVSEPAAPSAGESERSIPFMNKEPETYSATVEISYNGHTETTHISKKGLKRRVEYRAGTDRSLVLIESDLRYAVDPGRKVYTILEDAAGSEEPEFIRDLTSQLLSVRADSKFERLSSEDGLERYRVTVGGSQSTEIIVYVDPVLQLPVKQVFYSVSDGKRVPAFSVVFKDMVLAVDDTAFQLPPDHKQIDPKVFYRDLRDRGDQR